MNQYLFKDKRVMYLYITLFIIMALIGCSSHQTKIAASSNVSFLDMVIFKIGKADSMLLMAGGKTVLIDSGEDKDGDKVVKYLEENNIDKIDYMILTHFDKDHVGGVDVIINSVDVGQIITPNYKRSSKQYREYKNAITANHKTPKALINTYTFSAGTAEFTVYPPQKNKYKEENDYSLVVSVKHGNNSLLLTADAVEERLDELMGHSDIEHTFLKVPHHGKFEANTLEFFSMVKPQFAVITSARKRNKTVKALEKLGTKVFVTRNGNVYVKSDGYSMSMQQ
ncbi:MBL fold metallo-hydrolase [Viridibacillus sp. YIM B01967]|uniref:MBL fold metallo-hydrolase n=1 Tax=Viridibacillus soli TaxID=2798301 RepID=A0ABS1H5U0_9BACL|nr:MBL fold metallo-hydrolase [Viridibacillus soli]MBK3494761.1 MBL fold metallo-hydrolase [Viridibacillus soli]